VLPVAISITRDIATAEPRGPPRCSPPLGRSRSTSSRVAHAWPSAHLRLRPRVRVRYRRPVQVDVSPDHPTGFVVARPTPGTQPVAGSLVTRELGRLLRLAALRAGLRRHGCVLTIPHRNLGWGCRLAPSQKLGSLRTDRDIRRLAIRWQARYCAEVSDVGFKAALAETVPSAPARAGGRGAPPVGYSRVSGSSSPQRQPPALESTVRFHRAVALAGLPIALITLLSPYLTTTCLPW
jgi:hypothetical protein